ncbi:MAG: protoporphyrinogen oxidase [Chlamydiia bacterium]|nr:protoporphyrinogen oxidase [Chlamydiia bacterium]
MYDKIKSVKIRGAGIRGLSLAHFLKQKGVDSILYDKAPRAGGWIKTVKENGFLFEAGPRGIRPHPITLRLIEELQLSDQIIYPDPAAKKRFIYYKGKLRPLGALLPLLSFGLLKDLFLPAEKEELTIKDHFEKRLGKWATNALIDPMVSGIFAGDINKLSAKKCFPSMVCNKSILAAMLSQPRTPLISFKGGMETLIHRFQADHEVKLNQAPENFDVDCTLDPKYESVSIVAVTIGWHDLKLPVKGFGYLVPTSEKEPILGAVFDSATFPSQNQSPDEARVTVMMGGANNPLMIDFPDEKLSEIALDSLSKHLNINVLPDYIRVHKARDAIPQPIVGSDLNGVGVNHAIESSCKLADSLVS